MNVQAEVSFYPLRSPTLTEPIDRFIRRLGTSGLDVRMGNMSTQLSGECGGVFHALAGAFEEAAANADAVLIVKVSNACPPCAEDPRRSGGRDPVDR